MERARVGEGGENIGLPLYQVSPRALVLGIAEGSELLEKLWLKVDEARLGSEPLLHGGMSASADCMGSGKGGSLNLKTMKRSADLKGEASNEA